MLMLFCSDIDTDTDAKVAANAEAVVDDAKIRKIAFQGSITISLWQFDLQPISRC